MKPCLKCDFVQRKKGGTPKKRGASLDLFRLNNDYLTNAFTWCLVLLWKVASTT